MTGKAGGIARDVRASRAIYLLIIFSGFAALSWEILWQVKSTLAIGVSAEGTAITLAATMGGMCIGGLMMGHMLRKHPSVQPVWLYGLLEMIIGLAGLFLGLAFHGVERLDTWVYARMPAYASLIHLSGIVAVLGIPTICMGASLPVFGLIARQFKLSLATLYGLNTLGAATGVMFVALVLIPALGISHAAWAIAAINMLVGLFAWQMQQTGLTVADKKEPDAQNVSSEPVSWRESLIVLATGFATFTLEIAWFRALAGTFLATTDMFAVMLATMLLALAMGARSVAWLKRRKLSPGTLLCCAGILILLTTPIVERFDYYYWRNVIKLSAYIKTALSDNAYMPFFYIGEVCVIFIITLCLIGPSVWFLGIAFPWILDEHRSSRRVGILYALNTAAGIAGALAAAWIMLPAIGLARTAWVAGASVAIAGIAVMPARNRLLLATLSIAALLVAGFFESGIGKTRVQGLYFLMGKEPPKVLEAFEGPDATVSVMEYYDGARRLLIDSASAAGESGPQVKIEGHYMQWMGHLPMLLAPDPKNALVICFGTGQTANAVRNENPQSLDIVDVNPRIFKLAHNFRSNENVLGDPKVSAIAMDGRAYLRRTQKTYDIITLEPMPPTSAGVNALYSKEFYELARDRLGPKGVIAQWLPIHAVAPFYAASIARTFMEVFPNAILWIDPESSNDAILLGTKDNSVALGTNWPGFGRVPLRRDRSEKEVRSYVLLDTDKLKRYVVYGDIISDDNQLLAYGGALYPEKDLAKKNYILLHTIDDSIPIFGPEGKNQD